MPPEYPEAFFIPEQGGQLGDLLGKKKKRPKKKPEIEKKSCFFFGYVKLIDTFALPN